MEAANGTPVAKLQLLAELGSSTIIWMGLSFILGSLFTVLILMLLDFMRQQQEDEPPQKDED